MMRQGGSLRAVANHFRIEPGAPAGISKENTGATRENGRWKIVDHRSRQFPFYSNGAVVNPWMSLDQTSEAGRSCRRSSSSSARAIPSSWPFTGKGARDVNGKFYPFELDENTLYELDHRDEAVIPEQYRISERIAS